MKKKKAVSNQFTTVTPLSKALAFIIFITSPFVGFFLGTYYQKKLDAPYMIRYENPKFENLETNMQFEKPTETIIKDQVMCTQDAKKCPDGSFVSRIPPSCEFEACPEN